MNVKQLIDRMIGDVQVRLYKVDGGGLAQLCAEGRARDLRRFDGTEAAQIEYIYPAKMEGRKAVEVYFSDRRERAC